MSENGGYSNQQNLFLKKIANEINEELIRSKDNNYAEKLIKRFYNNGFNKNDIIKIATNFNDLDNKNSLINFLDIHNKIATEKTMEFLNDNP